MIVVTNGSNPSTISTSSVKMRKGSRTASANTERTLTPMPTPSERIRNTAKTPLIFAFLCCLSGVCRCRMGICLFFTELLAMIHRGECQPTIVHKSHLLRFHSDWSQFSGQHEEHQLQPRKG